MRIVIDLQACQATTQGYGIGRYAMALTKAMIRRNEKHEFLLVLNGSYPDSIAEISKSFSGLLPKESLHVFHTPANSISDNPESAWRTLAAEYVRESFLTSLQPDIIHLASIFDPDTIRGNAVNSIGKILPANISSAIIYDLIPLRYPKHYLADEAIKRWYDSKVEHIKKAGLLLAISGHTRLEAIELLNMPQDRVVNILAACDKHFCPMTKADCQEASHKLQKQYMIKNKFIMYAPSGYDNRKNIARLIKAFALLPEELRSSHQLVLVGKAGELNQRQVRSWATKAGLTDADIIMTGYVTDDTLVAFYNLAALFVFPSWHEGFGLPALEAMACGTATIASNTTSLPEVIGRQDALFDPFDHKSIAQKTVQVLQDDDFCKELQAHGVQQAAKFSWDESARLTMDAFEELHLRTSKRAMPAPEIRYRELINFLRYLPQKKGGPTDQDLIAISNSIAQNKLQGTD